MDSTVKFVLTGFGSARSYALGVSRLSIGPSNMHHGPSDMQYVVVDDSVMPFCIVFGVDFLTLHDITLDFEEEIYRQSGQPILSHRISCVLQSSDVPTVAVISCLPPVTGSVGIGTSAEHVMFDVNWDLDGDLFDLRSLLNPDQGLSLQNHCPQLRSLKKHLTTNKSAWPRSLSGFKRSVESLSLVDDFLLHTSHEKKTYVVTFIFLVELRWRTLEGRS